MPVRSSTGPIRALFPNFLAAGIFIFWVFTLPVCVRVRALRDFRATAFSLRLLPVYVVCAAL